MYLVNLCFFMFFNSQVHPAPLQVGELVTPFLEHADDAILHATP
jgi:hypothetical protein